MNVLRRFNSEQRELLIAIAFSDSYNCPDDIDGVLDQELIEELGWTHEAVSRSAESLVQAGVISVSSGEWFNEGWHDHAYKLVTDPSTRVKAPVTA